MEKLRKNENIDHIYCNKLNVRENPLYSEKANFIGNEKTVAKLKNFIFANLNLIEELQNQLEEKDSYIEKLLKQNEGLKREIKLLKHSKSSNKKIDSSKDLNNITNNYIQPANKNKSIEKKRDHVVKERVSIDSSDDEIFRKKSDDSQESISIKLSSKNLFLMTNTPYLINDWKICDLEDEEIQKGFDDIQLEVPRWQEIDADLSADDDAEVAITVEDMSDEAFLKRHSKLEVDERRRKRWDQQRIREQKNIERLKKRHLKEEYADSSSVSAKVPKTMNSFFPDIDTIRFIQISDSDLPVCPFGEFIPKLKFREFSLPWLRNPSSTTLSDDDNSNIYSIQNICPLKVRTKFITRCSNKQQS